jgi:ApaG protein
VSEALTTGVRVTVRSHFLPEQSESGRWVFAYTVRIANEGPRTVQLRNRHWVIVDGNGQVEEVRGSGVVGQQPVLRAGEAFEYTSGCVLKTPRGSMRGSYEMVLADDGSSFLAEIAQFDLTAGAAGRGPARVN